MKETVNISIAGISFVLEKDAHEEISGYIKIIESSFSERGDEGREIIEDIESRIAELLLSRQNANSKIITLECIKEVIHQMGMPDSDDSDSFDYAQETSKSRPSKISIKRLYRNGDGAKLGGLLNGIASYFATDVALVRLLFIIIIIVGSFISGSVVAWTLAVYGIGWIVVPLAKTPLQKLEMQGEPITVSALNNFRNSENKNGVDYGIISIIGRIIKFILLVIVATLAVSIIVQGIAVVIALIYGLVNFEMLNSLLNWNVPFTMVTVAIVTLIPIFLLGSLFLNILFSTKTPRFLYYILVPIWIISLFAAGIIVYKEVVSRGIERSVSTTIVEKVPGNTIFMDSFDLDERNDNTPAILDDLIYNDTYISFHESSDSLYRVIVTKTSNGSSRANAISNAEDIDVKYKLEGDTIYIPTKFKLSEGAKQNWQRASIDVYCPQGGKILFTSDIERKVYGEFAKEGEHYAYAPKCDKATVLNDTTENVESDSLNVEKLGISISKDSINTEVVDKSGKIERTVIKINTK